MSEKRYIQAALKALDGILQSQRENGGLPGRLDSNWLGQADWDCLTGDAQAAVAWIRAYGVTGEKKYLEAAKFAVAFIKTTINIKHPNPGIRGGVKGSYPFDAPYGQFELLNWASKFFCDALLMITASTGITG